MANILKKSSPSPVFRMDRLRKSRLIHNPPRERQTYLLPRYPGQDYPSYLESLKINPNGRGDMKVILGIRIGNAVTDYQRYGDPYVRYPPRRVANLFKQIIDKGWNLKTTSLRPSYSQRIYHIRRKKLGDAAGQLENLSSWNHDLLKQANNEGWLPEFIDLLQNENKRIRFSRVFNSMEDLEALNIELLGYNATSLFDTEILYPMVEKWHPNPSLYKRFRNTVAAKSKRKELFEELIPLAKFRPGGGESFLEAQSDFEVRLGALAALEALKTTRLA